MSDTETTFIKRRALTLYVIIAMKLMKGILLLLLAAGIFSLSDENLPEVFSKALLFLRLDPETNFFTELARKIATISSASLLWVAAGTVFYSLFSLVEGTGLIYRVPWAGWLTIGESAFFIPIEVYECMKRYSLPLISILALNVFIVWYLFQNRRRLFRHHHH